MPAIELEGPAVCGFRVLGPVLPLARIAEGRLHARIVRSVALRLAQHSFCARSLPALQLELRKLDQRTRLRPQLARLLKRAHRFVDTLERHQRARKLELQVCVLRSLRERLLHYAERIRASTLSQQCGSEHAQRAGVAGVELERTLRDLGCMARIADA
jgi:hypothetical protein